MLKKKKIIQEDVSTLILLKTCKKFSSLYDENCAYWENSVFQHAVLCLFTTGKLEQPRIKLLLEEKWILKGERKMCSLQK